MPAHCGCAFALPSSPAVRDSDPARREPDMRHVCCSVQRQAQTKDRRLAVAQWVAALPGAVGRLHALGPSPLLAMSLGTMVVASLRMLLRLAGIAIFVAGVVWAAAAPMPDILIGANGDSVAVRGADGRLRACAPAATHSR